MDFQGVGKDDWFRYPDRDREGTEGGSTREERGSVVSGMRNRPNEVTKIQERRVGYGRPDTEDGRINERICLNQVRDSL